MTPDELRARRHARAKQRAERQADALQRDMAFRRIAVRSDRAWRLALAADTRNASWSTARLIGLCVILIIISVVL